MSPSLVLSAADLVRIMMSAGFVVIHWKNIFQVGIKWLQKEMNEIQFREFAANLFRISLAPDSGAMEMSEAEPVSTSLSYEII